MISPRLFTVFFLLPGTVKVFFFLTIENKNKNKNKPLSINADLNKQPVHHRGIPCFWL